jgi:hypothetical protein
VNVQLPRENFRPDTRPEAHPLTGMFGGGFFKRAVPAINREPEVEFLLWKHCNQTMGPT